MITITVLFIPNMFDTKTQRKLRRDTVESKRALSITINMAMGHINQQRNAANNSQSVRTIQQQQFQGAKTSQNQCGRNTNIR